jgi:cysteine synthase B
MVPGIYDPSLADENLGVRTEDAHAMARRLARESGLLLGVSAAAAVVGCLQVAESLKKLQAAMIVTILADSGDKYLSERFWTEGEVRG